MTDYKQRRNGCRERHAFIYISLYGQEHVSCYFKIFPFLDTDNNFNNKQIKNRITRKTFVRQIFVQDLLNGNEDILFCHVFL